MSIVPSSGLLSSFRFRIIVLLILASFLAAGSFWSFFTNRVFPEGSILLLLTAIVIYQLFAIINKTNHDLTQFLSGILYNDFESTYRQGLYNEESQQLYSMFNVITDKFRELRMQKEFQHQYLQAIVSQVDTGVICFDEKGNTLMMNNALKSMLHKSHFPTFSSVHHFNKPLYQCLQTIQPQEDRNITIDIGTEQLILNIRLRILKMEEQQYSLYSMQDISRQMDEQEIHAWEKLIRVLTHEIMNSITPITSLSGSLRQLIEQSEKLEGEDLQDIRDSIRAIENRSKGLLSFTRAYRQFTRIPQIDPTPTDMGTWLQDITNLLKSELEQNQIKLTLKKPKQTLNLSIDQTLLSKVIINLLKNAMEAVIENEESREIGISLTTDREGQHLLSVADNGMGIPLKDLTNIFVPFYTTKKQGTGIGLSLSRRIMNAHGGRLTVWSKEGEGTIFTVVLPK